MSSTIKGKHGGYRPGAGRKRSLNPTKWVQIGIVMTEDEIRRVKMPYLTPAQRLHRLLCPVQVGQDNARTEHEIEQEVLKVANLRIPYKTDAERLAIFALSVPERRRRLLTVPPGGDLLDDRDGRWTRRLSG